MKQPLVRWQFVLVSNWLLRELVNLLALSVARLLLSDLLESASDFLLPRLPMA